MTTFYIFRHGHTYATWNKMPYGETVYSANIIPQGFESIKKIGEYLRTIPSDFNISSEFKRCRETVKIISEITGKKFEFDKRLNEDIEQDKNIFIKRVKSFLDDTKKKHYQNILICSHGAVLSAIKYLVLTGKVNEVQLNDFPAPGIILVIKGKTLKELDFNLL